MNKNGEHTINTGSVKFKKINSTEARKNIYKKITKKDFVFALTFSFLFAFGIFGFKNAETFKADLFDSTDQVIYDGEKDRTFDPTLSFYPENKVISNGTSCDSYDTTTDADGVEHKTCVGKTHFDYYVTDTPNNTIEISLDNVVSDPTCSYGRRYKFQGTTQYLKLGETINESSTSVYGANYPLLSKQKGTNANYKIDSTGTGVTIYFDKDIKNGKYYDFAFDDGITFYQNYKTLEEFETGTRTYSIKGNELKITFPNKFETDFGRIVIKENLISDLDGRINNQKSVIGKKISEEIVIDNKKPAIDGTIDTSDDTINIITFSENIYENPNLNILDNITHTGTIDEYNIEGNKLKIYGSNLNITGISDGIVLDKGGNEFKN